MPPHIHHEIPQTPRHNPISPPNSRSTSMCANARSWFARSAESPEKSLAIARSISPGLVRCPSIKFE
ncbi:MAG: hypothetical protein ACKOF3_08905 [Spartobacteria bacterium]